MIYLWLLFGVVGISKTLTVELVSPIKSSFKIVYNVRIYQRMGRSHEQWREMTPPDRHSTPSTAAKERCTTGSVTPSSEKKARAEQVVGQHRKS
jgi:hypothetical protein